MSVRTEVRISVIKNSKSVQHYSNTVNHKEVYEEDKERNEHITVKMTKKQKNELTSVLVNR